jgi:hypothetical protein
MSGTPIPFSLVSAHSKTVGADAEIPLQPPMQVSPTGPAIAEAPPLMPEGPAGSSSLRSLTGSGGRA